MNRRELKKELIALKETNWMLTERMVLIEKFIEQKYYGDNAVEQILKHPRTYGEDASTSQSNVGHSYNLRARNGGIGNTSKNGKQSTSKPAAKTSSHSVEQYASCSSSHAGESAPPSSVKQENPRSIIKTEKKW